jgi:hypothetical protein
MPHHFCATRGKILLFLTFAPKSSILSPSKESEEFIYEKDFHFPAGSGIARPRLRNLNAHGGKL